MDTIARRRSASHRLPRPMASRLGPPRPGDRGRCRPVWKSLSGRFSFSFPRFAVGLRQSHELPSKSTSSPLGACAITMSSDEDFDGEDRLSACAGGRPRRHIGPSIAGVQNLPCCQRRQHPLPNPVLIPARRLTSAPDRARLPCGACSRAVCAVGGRWPKRQLACSRTSTPRCSTTQVRARVVLRRLLPPSGPARHAGRARLGLNLAHTLGGRCGGRQQQGKEAHHHAVHDKV